MAARETRGIQMGRPWIHLDASWIMTYRAEKEMRRDDAKYQGERSQIRDEQDTRQGEPKLHPSGSHMP